MTAIGKEEEEEEEDCSYLFFSSNCSFREIRKRGRCCLKMFRVSFYTFYLDSIFPSS